MICFEVQQQFKVAEYEAKKTMASIENAVTDVAKDEEEEEVSGPSVPKFKPPVS